MNNPPMPRERYMDRLLSLKDESVIKAIVGIHRCGKSTLLGMFRDHLLSSGVDEGNVVSMDLTHAPDPGMTAADILEAVSGRTGRVYVLLDGVRALDGWDDMLITMSETVDCDIYITGSDSAFTNILSDRVVTVEMFPFSYPEFLSFTGTEDSDQALAEYMTYGGFPTALMMRPSEDAEVAVLEDIHGSMLLNGVVRGNSIRNLRALETIERLLMQGIGTSVTVKSLRDRMVRDGLRVNFETVDSYLRHLEDALMFHRVGRYDIRNKREMVLNDRFYPGDPGLMTAMLGGEEVDTEHLMEGLVYLELRRRGYTVNVGRIGDMEVDLVARDGERTIYIQVCHSLRDPSTEAREVRPLRMIRDDNRKVIIVMERSVNADRDGIAEIGLREFLLGAGL